MTVRTGPTAPITAPGTYESLAKYAPGGDDERQRALRYAAGRGGGNGTSPLAQMASLVMGGATPAEAPGTALTPAQQALKWAGQRSLLAQAARIGGTAIGRGDAPGYAALERAAQEPLRGLEMETAEAQTMKKAARQRALRDPASEESRAMQQLLGTVPGMEEAATGVTAEQAPFALDVAQARARMQPRPGPSKEELALEERRVAADERRALASLIAARRAGGAGASPHQQAITERFQERQIERLGKDAQEYAILDRDMRRLLQAIEPEDNGDIPGAGYLESRLPGWALSESGVANRQAAMRIAARLLHEISGAAVTPSEAERFMAGRGMGPGATETEFRQGAKALAYELKAALRAREAKYPPKIVELFRSRGGATAQDLPDVARPKNGAPAAGRDEVQVIGPDGKRRAIPRARLHAALAAGARQL